MIFKFRAIFIFLIYLPNFILAEGIQGLVEENFGERFYGIYVDDYKLGFIAYKLSQNKNDVIADFSMTVRIPASLARKEVEGAKYALSQTVTRHIFDKKTGLLNQMSETHGEKLYRDYDELIENRQFEENVGTLIAKYKGNFTYEVVNTDDVESQVNFYKLPTLNMVDHFAEINFIHSNPKVGDYKKIDVSDLDFKNGIFSSVVLTLKQKIKLNTIDDEYQFVISLEQDNGDISTLTTDRFGNLIAGEWFGMQVVREPKDKALTLDATNI